MSDMNGNFGLPYKIPRSNWMTQFSVLATVKVTEEIQEIIPNAGLTVQYPEGLIKLDSGQSLQVTIYLNGEWVSTAQMDLNSDSFVQRSVPSPINIYEITIPSECGMVYAGNQVTIGVQFDQINIPLDFSPLAVNATLNHILEKDSDGSGPPVLTIEQQIPATITTKGSL